MGDRLKTSFKERFKLAEWMRSTEGNTQHLTADEYVAAATKATGIETNINQIRRIAAQADIKIAFRGRQGTSGNQWMWMKEQIAKLDERLSRLEDELL